MNRTRNRFVGHRWACVTASSTVEGGGVRHPATSRPHRQPAFGRGKAARFDLVAECRARGIDPILFEPGDDLTTLATAAVRAGANALGMAGGDGSQAAVAAVAAEHDLPHVCVPAGTEPLRSRSRHRPQ